MSKIKHSEKTKIQACQQYLAGQKTAIQLAAELKIGKCGANVIRSWVKMYRANGLSAFQGNGKNNSYSKETKLKAINEYINGKSSFLDIAIKYKVKSDRTVRDWIKKYNSHIELKDYDPKPEVYMANTLKTTLEERIKIVKDCLEHDRDIKGTAMKYGCNYAQLYQWIRKYEANGETALTDKRGRRKPENELSEIEKAKRKIAQLEREKEKYRMCYELLKKAEERERW